MLTLALAQEPLSDLPKKPVGDGMFGVVVQVHDVLPKVYVADVEVPLVDDGTGPDAVADDEVYSGEVPAPGLGSVVVMVGEEEAFRDQVPLNAGERVRVLMSERGASLAFEPAEFDEPEPPALPPDAITKPEETAPQPPEVILLVVGCALLLGLAAGVWLGRSFLGARRGRPVQATRGGKPVAAGLYTDADLLALTAEGRTVVLREKLDIDGVLTVADDNPSAMVVAFAEHIEGDLAEIEREGLPNLIVLGAGDAPLVLG